MEKGGDGILIREGVEPRFGSQNIVLHSDSLVELTPQQVKEDRQWRVHRIGSLGWEHVGISPEGAPKRDERRALHRITSQFAQK